MDDNLKINLHRHRRSISQLIASMEDEKHTNSGASNSGMVNDDGIIDVEKKKDDTERRHEAYAEATTSSDLPDFQFSMIDAEYDETLAFPDSVTILSNVGDRPVLVERKEIDDEEVDNSDVVLEIPFKSVYSASIKFNSFQRKVFIPGVDVIVKIIDTERNVTTHFLSPNLYTIELTHGPFTWTIKKRYKHFNSLHQQLMVFRASLNIPFPIRRHKEKKATMKTVAIQMEEKLTTNVRATNVKKVEAVDEKDSKITMSQKKKKTT